MPKDYQPISPTNSGSDLLKSLKKESLEIVKEMIAEIDAEIELRKSVSRQTMEKLDSVIGDIDNLLLQFPKINIAAHHHEGIGPEIVKSMTELRKQKIQTEQLKAQEQVNLWRDIANLKREQRILIREFRETETKDSLLDDLIGD